MAVFGVHAAFKYFRETKLSVGIPVLAILLATLGGWLIDGQYSTCSLVFFILGSVVHQRRAGGASVWNTSIEQTV
jgi:hypothetical protein